MNTTKGKSVLESLRMIADWIEEDNIIEHRHFDAMLRDWVVNNKNTFDFANYEYRARHEKPSLIFNYRDCNGRYRSYVERTPEVIAACKAAGIEVDG